MDSGEDGGGCGQERDEMVVVENEMKVVRVDKLEEIEKVGVRGTRWKLWR